MTNPQASRPLMPGYGIVPADEGTGLLPWSWAVEQLNRSHDYWVATVGPDGQPHALPVWGVWWDEALWFSASGRSRKMRNLRAQPRCALTTLDAQEPVMLQGVAMIVTGREAIAGFVERVNAKYDASVSIDFLDPTVNATVRVPPSTVIALQASDFSGSPTRWTF